MSKKTHYTAIIKNPYTNAHFFYTPCGIDKKRNVKPLYEPDAKDITCQICLNYIEKKKSQHPYGLLVNS